MPDDLSNLGGQDRARIILSEEHEVRLWIEKFGISQEALNEAVDQVGSSADAVAAYLGKAI